MPGDAALSPLTLSVCCFIIHHLGISGAHVSTVLSFTLASLRKMNQCPSATPKPSFRAEQMAPRVIGLMEDETTIWDYPVHFSPLLSWLTLTIECLGLLFLQSVWFWGSIYYLHCLWFFRSPLVPLSLLVYFVFSLFLCILRLRFSTNSWPSLTIILYLRVNNKSLFWIFKTNKQQTHEWVQSLW